MGPDGSFDLQLSPSKPFADISSLMSPPHQPRPPTPPPQTVRTRNMKIKTRARGLILNPETRLKGHSSLAGFGRERLKQRTSLAGFFLKMTRVYWRVLSKYWRLRDLVLWPFIGCLSTDSLFYIQSLELFFYLRSSTFSLSSFSRPTLDRIFSKNIAFQIGHMRLIQCNKFSSLYWILVEHYKDVLPKCEIPIISFLWMYHQI